MPRLSKKVRRELSADESLQQYFRLLEREYCKRMSRQWRLSTVVLKKTDNTAVVLQVHKVWLGDQGIYIEVI